MPMTPNDNTAIPRPTEGGAGGHGEDLDPAEIRWHQLQHLKRQVPMMTAVSIVNALALAAVLGGWPPAPLSIFWAAAVVLPSLYNFLGSRRRRRSAPAVRQASKAAIWRSIAWSAYMGAVWGSIGPVFLDGASLVEIVFPVFVIGGMMAGLVASLAPLPGNVAAFGITAGIPTFATLALGATQLEHGMAAMFALFCVGLGIAAWNAYHRFREILAMKRDLSATSDLLTDAIESTGEAFALYGPDGRLLMANSQFENFFPQGAAQRPPFEDTALELADGRWVKSSQKPTRAGGRVEVYSDVTVLKKQEDALIAARIEAEAADRAKSQFLAVMSHELRTPLNSVIGFAELLGRERVAMSADRVREYSGVIVKSGRHLLELITDILNLSRIEAGRYDLHEEQVDIDAMLSEIAESFAPQMETAGLELSLRPGFGGLMSADARALRQILDNLISNALKFTEPGGRIVIATECRYGDVRIIVEDSGIGIPQESQTIIFEPFRQVDERLARAKGGTGLGLPLVRRLAELHGGSATVESKPGRGSRFMVHLPAERILSLSAAGCASA